MRWSECDPANIVYFPHYLTYFELGSLDYLRSRGADWTAIGRHFGYYSFPRVEAHARYRGSARYNDVIAVHTWVGDVARKIVTFDFQIHRPSDGAFLTEGHMKVAPVDTQRRAALITPAFRDWLLGAGPLGDAPSTPHAFESTGEP